MRYILYYIYTKYYTIYMRYILYIIHILQTVHSFSYLLNYINVFITCIACLCAMDRWVDSTGSVVTDGGRVKVDSTGLLSFSSAQQSDSGNYTCIASNLAREVGKRVWVVVSGKCLGYCIAQGVNVLELYAI